MVMGVKIRENNNCCDDLLLTIQRFNEICSIVLAVRCDTTGPIDRREIDKDA